MQICGNFSNFWGPLSQLSAMKINIAYSVLQKEEIRIALCCCEMETEAHGSTLKSLTSTIIAQVANMDEMFSLCQVIFA